MNLEKAQELEEQISKWNTRARMAHKKGSVALTRSALKEKIHYKKLLHDLRRSSDGPPYMSLVPLRQPPDVGAGEIALPLPTYKDEEA
jgi:hypothetical protein